jgi:hypothetical protein
VLIVLTWPRVARYSKLAAVTDLRSSTIFALTQDDRRRRITRENGHDYSRAIASGAKESGFFPIPTELEFRMVPTDKTLKLTIRHQILGVGQTEYNWD